MKKSLVFFALTMLAALSGLVVSSLLLVDYVRPSPVFCEESGCDAVKHTAFAHILGVPLPAFGMLGFAVLGTLTLIRGKPARLAALALALSMGLFAAVLLGVQKMMGSFCPFCVVTDVSAIVAMVGVAVRFSDAWDPPRVLSVQAGGGVALALAMAIPVGVGMKRAPKIPPPPPGLPEPIAREIGLTPIGKVSVVDFVDFECPFCRATHAAMEPVTLRHQDRLRIVRKQVPLRIHPHARDAAKAACCAEDFGHGDDFAQALFSTPTEKLTPDGCETLAESVGIDRAKFRECVQSTRVEDRLKADSDTFKAVHGHGLPTIWVDTEELKGEQNEGELEDAVSRALVRRGQG
jgi:protein-disulfide isomerase